VENSSFHPPSVGLRRGQTEERFEPE
jgi:hypothetical protein